MPSTMIALSKISKPRVLDSLFLIEVKASDTYKIGRIIIPKTFTKKFPNIGPKSYISKRDNIATPI